MKTQHTQSPLPRSASALVTLVLAGLAGAAAGAQAQPEGYRETIQDGTLLFGLDPSWADGREFETVFDGDPDTFYDYAFGDARGFAGFDNGEPVVPETLRFTPREGRASRMVGGEFQGSNETPWSGYETLHTVETKPSAGPNEVAVAPETAYRYYRYIAPEGAYGNIAEFSLEGYEEAAPPPSDGGSDTVDADAPDGYREMERDGRVGFGLDPPWRAGREFGNALDGDPDSFYDYAHRDEISFAGFDHGSKAVPVTVRFRPRAG